MSDLVDFMVEKEKRVTKRWWADELEAAGKIWMCNCGCTRFHVLPPTGDIQCSGCKVLQVFPWSL